MSNLTVFLIAQMVGFTPHQAKIATCVAHFESHKNPLAINNTLNSDGSQDIGLMQINDKIWGNKLCVGLDLYNATDNMRCAYRIYQQNRTFTHWAAFNKHKDKCLKYKVK